MRRHWLLTCALPCVFSLFQPSCVAAQEPPPPPPPPPSASVTEPLIHGTAPQPEPAIKAIYEAFSRYEVVAMEAGHGKQNIDSFLLSLLSDARFPGRIDDIVVECGNSLYQSTLDRYIAGDEVDKTQVQKVWRNTTQPMCAVSGFYQQLFPLVRRINQRLPKEKRVRVLAADVPVHWELIKTRSDLLHSPQDRDRGIATLMEREVLSRHRKALMLFGISHLYHGPMTSPTDLGAVALYEQKYPGVTLVIADHTGFGNDTPYARFNEKFERGLGAWPIPSIVIDLKGTSLADALDKTQSLGTVTRFSTSTDGKRVQHHAVIGEGRHFAEMTDAYLYLGPRDLLLNEPVPANTMLDKSYMDEMRRRASLMGSNPVTDQADPDKVSAAGYDAFLYPSSD